MLELKDVVELALKRDQIYNYYSHNRRLTGRHHMTSPIHPDSGPIVCYVSHRRSKDVEGCTIGISISLLALMADSRDRRARAIESEVKEVCRARLSALCGRLGIASLYPYQYEC
jgi:hypothetical protein